MLYQCILASSLNEQLQLAKLLDAALIQKAVLNISKAVDAHVRLVQLFQLILILKEMRLCQLVSIHDLRPILLREDNVSQLFVLSF